MPDQTEPEVAAIFDRLRAEIRRESAPGEDRAKPASRSLAARSQAERAWAVTAERPFEQSPTRRGAVQRYMFVPMKRLLRKSMRWYVEPVAADQRSFNLAVLNLVDEVAAGIEADLNRLERRLESLEARLSSDGDERRG
jgi:hypothetical protein